MSRHILFRFLLAFSMTGLLTTCHKDKTDCEYQPIAKSMQGFLFRTNSWWVYKNDSLNSYDSVFIASTQTGCNVFEYAGDYCARVDYYRMNYNGKWNAVNYYDVVEIIFLARNSEPMSPDFIYNHKGWMLYAGPDTAIHDSLKVGDTTFYPVVKSSGSYDDYKNVTVYTAKNVGIVRRVINTNPKQVWDLVRWKIYK